MIENYRLFSRTGATGANKGAPLVEAPLCHLPESGCMVDVRPVAIHAAANSRPTSHPQVAARPAQKPPIRFGYVFAKNDPLS